ncbi:MAG: hypothetical protein N3G80_01645 [Candidatus Micrarchaeota archaeon]|nr:hypothetical protein [Candidatus Micrarchaeota archaeon]
MLVEEIIEKLQIVPTDKLRPHEEIIPYNFQKLREAMLNMGRLVDPIIIDTKTFVVLDGNHRRKVLESIKCPNAACQLVDYFSPEITVGSWFPVSKTIRIEDVPFKPEPVDFEEGLKALQNLEATFMYVRSANGSKECFIYDSAERKLANVIANQRAFISALEGKEVQYVPDDKVDEYLAKGYCAFYRRAYTKQEIISEAMAGRVMPPKSTRHMIPNRIIRLNLHLGWLAESQEVAKQMMDDMLRRRLNEGSIRRYTETVIVLY